MRAAICLGFLDLDLRVSRKHTQNSSRQFVRNSRLKFDDLHQVTVVDQPECFGVPRFNVSCKRTSVLYKPGSHTHVLLDRLHANIRSKT